MTQNLFDKTISILDNADNTWNKWLDMVTPLVRKEAYEKHALIELGEDAQGNFADCHYFQQNSVLVLLTTSRNLKTDRIDMIDQSQKKLLSIYWNVGTNLDHVDSEVVENAVDHPTYKKITEKFGFTS